MKSKLTLKPQWLYLMGLSERTRKMKTPKHVRGWIPLCANDFRNFRRSLHGSNGLQKAKIAKCFAVLVQVTCQWASTPNIFIIGRTANLDLSLSSVSYSRNAIQITFYDNSLTFNLNSSATASIVSMIFLLKVAKLYYIQNRKEDCLAKCRDVCERATHLNSGNWPFLLTRAFYIISAVYRQTKEFDLANEYMDKSSEVKPLHTRATPSITDGGR